jgi:hypothetical protein
MKALVSILIALAVGFIGYKLFEHWEKVKEQRVLEEKATRGPDINPDQLPGLPWQLADKLRTAEQSADPAVLKRFIDYARTQPGVHDPRLAWIELDYVVRLSATDPVTAKKIFREVKKRTPEDSPIYPRIKSLEKAYD